jgi:hypothetical protein
LIELMGDAARHFLQGGHARDLHELLQQECCALLCLRRTGSSCHLKVPHRGIVPEASDLHTREFH